MARFCRDVVVFRIRRHICKSVDTSEFLFPMVLLLFCSATIDADLWKSGYDHWLALVCLPSC